VSFAPGDRVHIASLGTGVVREARNGGRYLIEIKGRTMVVDGGQMERAEPARPSRGAASGAKPAAESSLARPAAASIDLHGRTLDEALEALDAFLNDALMASLPEVRVIHGRGGGRLKTAVHKRLRELPPVRSFRIDSHNHGVTIVSL
jgi:DNA mismatch repair protein MutS2